MKPLRLAVDTNVLLDLAGGVDTVVDAFAVLDRRLASSDILVLPSVLDELAFLCDAAQTEPIRQSALRAIKLVRDQNRFRPLLELPWAQLVVEEAHDHGPREYPAKACTFRASECQFMVPVAREK